MQFITYILKKYKCNSSRIPDEIPVTIYKPESDHRNNLTLPIVVYFHGGGNVVKSRKTNENVCKLLARYVNLQRHMFSDKVFSMQNRN